MILLEGIGESLSNFGTMFNNHNQFKAYPLILDSKIINLSQDYHNCHAKLAI